MKFDFNELPNLYDNVRKARNNNGYIFSKNSSDYLEIYLLGENEYRFIIDNYPFQRRFFNTNIPYRNIEDFEFDLDRMRIEKPIRK